MIYSVHVGLWGNPKKTRMFFLPFIEYCKAKTFFVKNKLIIHTHDKSINAAETDGFVILPMLLNNMEHRSEHFHILIHKITDYMVRKDKTSLAVSKNLSVNHFIYILDSFDLNSFKPIEILLTANSKLQLFLC